MILLNFYIDRLILAVVLFKEFFPSNTTSKLFYTTRGFGLFSCIFVNDNYVILNDSSNIYLKMFFFKLPFIILIKYYSNKIIFISFCT